MWRSVFKKLGKAPSELNVAVAGAKRELRAHFCSNQIS
jgi:hypothetical protein